MSGSETEKELERCRKWLGRSVRKMSALQEHKVAWLAALPLLVYFLWMDVALYYRVQSVHLVGGEQPAASAGLFSPFTGLSVKLIMMDHVNSYVHSPLADLFNQVTRFSEVFYFITPNLISLAGVLSALAAAKVVTVDTIAMQHCAVLLMQLRAWFDALDGLVARSRMGLTRHMSMRDTSGYLVDGIADTIGFTLFLVGTFFYLRRKLPVTKHYLPIADPGTEKGSTVLSTFPVIPYPMKRIIVVLVCFGLQMGISCLFWDRYINAYHILLETASPAKEVAQSQVLRSSMMWIIMWFWKLCNAHAVMQMFLFAIFIGRMWEFLVWIQYVGYVVLGILIILTEIHLSSARSYLT
ncbi:ceramide phosphoethanolamine synthase-like isoform X2 [Ornithodoros turicata]|uniref:ceramide phosphoethanolamine synthase-like isoform X2 n=1 Tax=Ornithodoros turicata TaxID=34597 RepID=UPI00313902E8